MTEREYTEKINDLERRNAEQERQIRHLRDVSAAALVREEALLWALELGHKATGKALDS